MNDKIYIWINEWLEDEYLPENHPLRKLRIRDNPAVDALPGTIGIFLKVQ